MLFLKRNIELPMFFRPHNPPSVRDFILYVPSIWNGNKTILAFLFLLFCSNLISQNTISSSQLLATAKNEQPVLLEEKKLEFLKNTNFNMPVSDELEYRTEAEEMNFQEQEHTLRWSFTGIKERKEQKKYHQTSIQLQESERQLVFQEILFDRYRDLVDYLFLMKENDFLQQQKLVLDDQLNIMRTLAGQTTDFDIEDLIRTEDDWHELEIDILRLEKDIQDLEDLFATKIRSGTLIKIDTSDILNITQINSIILQLSDSLNLNVDVREQYARIAETNAEYNLEKAENQQTFDFVQLRYRDRDMALAVEREWHLGIGLQIPLKNANRIQLNELELERIEEENRLTLLQNTLSERIQNTKRDLAFSFQQYNRVKEQLEDSQAKYSFEEYGKLYGSDPLSLLYMKESLLKRERTLLQIEEDIFRDYLRLLDLTGKMVEVPLRNYLSGSLETF